MASTSRIILHSDRNVMFVDLSYFVFYRYYSTLTWWKHQAKEEVDINELMNETEYVDKFAKMFEKTLVSLVKSAKVDWDNVVLVRDCTRDTIWRMEYFPDYKATRDDKLGSFNRDIFKYVYCELLPQLMESYGFQMISHEKLEADDIVYLLKKKLRSVNIETKVTIITNDNDFIQMWDDNTVINNLMGKSIVERVQCDPMEYLKRKVIMGDKSDNIPCIMKKVGEKTAEKLAANDVVFEAFCVKNPQAREQHKLNTLLIDMNNIPGDLREDLYERVEVV